MLYDVEVEVEEVRGYCAAGYKRGDKFVIRGFYIEPNGSRICIHAITGMMSLLSPFAHGISAKDLGIGETDNSGFLQCPDPGEPYTCGGTVIFRLTRREIT